MIDDIEKLPRRERLLQKSIEVLEGKREMSSETTVASVTQISAEIDKDVILKLPLDGVNERRQAERYMRLDRVRELHAQIGDVPDCAATIHALLKAEGIEIHIDSVRRDLRGLGLT